MGLCCPCLLANEAEGRSSAAQPLSFAKVLWWPGMWCQVHCGPAGLVLPSQSAACSPGVVLGRH